MIRRKSLLSCAALLALTPALASAAPLDIPVAAKTFGMRPDVEQASLSPDGNKLAVLGAFGARGAALSIVDLTSADPQPVRILNASGDPERLDWCRWSSNTQLVCRIIAAVEFSAGEFTYASRMVSLGADGKGMQMLRTPQRNGSSLGRTFDGGSVIDWNGSADGHILMRREYVPEDSTASSISQKDEGFGVDDIDTVTLRSKRVEAPRATAIEYISDGTGSVRIMGVDNKINREGYASERIHYLYRLKDKRDWTDLSDYDRTTQTGFNPFHVDPTLNLAYGLDKLDGRMAAYSLSLDGSLTKTLVLSRPDVDIDGFVTIGRNRRVIGVTYTTDDSEVVYFDQALKKLADSLAKALPDLPQVRVVDSSQDERKLLIWAGSDRNAGQYYRLDRDSKQLAGLLPTRSALQGVQLGQMRTVSIPVGEGVSVPGYLTLPVGSDGKNLPAIVMPHGGPASRDTWGFDWLVQYWVSIGYAVLQPNFRGSAGYGDAWFQENGFRSWPVAIGDVAAAGRWLVSQGIADRSKLAIFGWSYGGYAALQSAVTYPDLFKAVVAVAPVTDLTLLKSEARNYSDYRLQRDFIGSGDHIDSGSPARHADKIAVPVLMFHGKLDSNVNYRESTLMDDKLRGAGKSSKLVLFDKLDHYLEDSDARTQMLQESANFMATAFAAGH